MSIYEENLFQIPENKNKIKDDPLSFSYSPINFNELLTDSHTADDNNPANSNQIVEPKDKKKNEIIPKSRKKQNRVRERKDSGEREFKCEEKGCSKVYRTKENLKLHILNIHLRLKPYECNYCSRRFSHRNGKRVS